MRYQGPWGGAGAQIGTHLAISLPQRHLERGFVVFILVLTAAMFRRSRDPRSLLALEKKRSKP